MMTNSPNGSANNEVWWTEGSWTGVVTPRAVMILPPSVPQDLTERLWRLLRSEEASLTRALDELVMGMGGRLGAIPDFVLAVSAPEDVFHVALRGAPQMEVDGKALDASAVTTWFETTVTAPNSVIVSAPDGAGQVRRPAVDAVVSTGHLVLRGSEKSSGTSSPSRASSKGSGDSDDDDPDPAGPDYSTTAAGSAGSPAAVRSSRSSRRASRRSSRRQSASSGHSEQDDSSEGAPAEAAGSPDVVDDLIEIAQDNAEQQALDGAELAASFEAAEVGQSATSAEVSGSPEEVDQLAQSDGPADLLAVVAGIADAAESTESVESAEPVESAESAEVSEELAEGTQAAEVTEADVQVVEESSQSATSAHSAHSAEPLEAPAVTLDAQSPEAAEVTTPSSPEASGEDLLIAPVFDIPALPIPSSPEAEAMIPPPPPPSSEDLEAAGIKDAAVEVTEVAQTPADVVPAEAAEASVVAEATAVAEAAAQAHAEDEPVRSGDHDGQTINGLPEDLSQELRAELLDQGLGPLEPSRSAEAAESAGSAAVAETVVGLVQPSADEPSTGGSEGLGRGDHDGQTINGLPEDLVGELVSLVGSGPSSPVSPASASSPSEPDAIRIVLSAVCPQGHPNPTNYTVCRVCGAELNRPAKSVACPPLGRVVTSGGESIELNRPLLVGRNPVADDITSVAEVPLRPLTVASPNQLVSRNHILIDLDAWSVLAQDLGNCNGTVLNRQNEAPVRLSSATPVLLRSGDVLDLGDGQTLAFENLP
ncbi:hypothetical protein BKH06_10345 [Actinomyces naeslundii]|uniref:FHA domain-containing protein n=1 Tax=Actinomyces naeslundii TaxID=1655 RepID=UPI00096E47F9|nr:FHA domain-containing protein [Actinomyces naeslundii]OMG09489.1 hypothetical protein BKH06_10345 [Actinomyces naeslundii]